MTERDVCQCCTSFPRGEFGLSRSFGLVGFSDPSSSIISQVSGPSILCPGHCNQLPPEQYVDQRVL
jgi:hypothetical protein